MSEILNTVRQWSLENCLNTKRNFTNSIGRAHTVFSFGELRFKTVAEKGHKLQTHYNKVSEYNYDECHFVMSLKINRQKETFMSKSLLNGARGSLVVRALGYKPESRGFENRWGEILNLRNPSGSTRPWGLLSL
jgi:hypothetical protein